MLKRFENKPWKAWTTRKYSFMYCLIFGAILIVYGAIATLMGFDVSSFLDVALSHLEWIVVTGAAITIVKAARKSDSEDE